MRIAMISSSLRQGGAERVWVRLAKAFHQNGHTVAIVTLDTYRPDDYALASGVQRIVLDAANPSHSLIDGARNNWQRVRKLRHACKEFDPDIVISALSETNVLALLAVKDMNIPVIISEHNDPRAFPLSWPWEKLRRRMYPRAAKLVSVSKGIDAFFSWLPTQQRVVIPNPFDLADLEKVGDAPSWFPPVGMHTIVALGRLVYIKGFDLLIEAFTKVAVDRPLWTLVIVGEGDQRDTLDRLVKERDLKQRVFLPGSLKSPHGYIKSGAFLTLPSRTEGFGLVLVEALACGLPVIAFDCPTGPRDIVEDGHNGFLVSAGNVDAFARAMAVLMDGVEQRTAMAKAALQSAKRFELSSIVQQWEIIFAELLNDRQEISQSFPVVESTGSS